MRRMFALVGALLVSFAMLSSCGEDSDSGDSGGGGSTPNSGSGTGGSGGSATGDGINAAPVPANDGALTVTTSTSTTAVVSWDPATDDSTAQDQLEYAVYFSPNDNLDQIDDILAHGGVGLAWSAGVRSATVTFPEPGGSFYVNVVVRDAEESMAIYTMKLVSLPSDAYISISYSPPNFDRSVVALTDVLYRTLTVTHDADSISCSTDGGSTWTSCASNTTAIWPADGFNDVFKIRGNKAGATNDGETISLTPSTAFASAGFVSCTATVSANESFDAFQARLVANAVVCLNNGVKIQNSDATLQGSVAVSADNVTIYVNKGETATIENQRTSGIMTFETTGSNTRLVGLTLNNSGPAEVIEFKGAGGLLLDSTVTSTSTSTGFEAVLIENQSNTKLKSSTISTAGAEGVRISGVTGVSLEDMNIATSTAGVGVYANNGARFSVFDSQITAAETAMTVASNADSNVSVAINVYDSSLKSTDSSSSGKVVRVLGANAGGGLLTIRDSEILASGGDSTTGALHIMGEHIVVDLRGSTFKRLDTGGDSRAIIVTNNNGNGAVLKGNESPNTFCKVGTVTFSSVLTADSAQTLFPVGSQANSGSVGTCL